MEDDGEKRVRLLKIWDVFSGEKYRKYNISIEYYVNIEYYFHHTMGSKQINTITEQRGMGLWQKQHG